MQRYKPTEERIVSTAICKTHATAQSPYELYFVSYYSNSATVIHVSIRHIKYYTTPFTHLFVIDSVWADDKVHINCE